MRYLLITIMFTSIFCSNCSVLFEPGIDRAVTTIFQGVYPDTCDLCLLNDFIKYRTDSLKFPTNSWINKKMQIQSEECRLSYNSIKINSFGMDSSDILITKVFSFDDNQKGSVGKYYRVRFKNDSLLNITPYIITSKDKYYGAGTANSE